MIKADRVLTKNLGDVSELIIARDELGVISICGVVLLDNVSFKVTIHRNLDLDTATDCVNKPAYSGTVSVLDPAGTRVLLSEVKKRKKIAKGKSFTDKDIYATIKYKCSSCLDEEIGAALADCIQSLIDENIEQLNASIQMATTPQTLTPRIASSAYAAQFVKQLSGTADNKQTTLTAIKTIMEYLPKTPICKLPPRKTNAILDAHKVSSKNRDLCVRFFDYLIAAGFCSGDNPLNTSKKEESDPEKDADNNLRRQELTQSEFDKFFQFINNTLCAIHCVIALLASGFPLHDIRTLRWRDIEFVPGFKDFVIVHISRYYKGVSKHDFARPAIPDTARYLHRSFSSFLHDRGKTVLDELVYPEDLETSQITTLANNYLVLAGYSDNLSPGGRPGADQEPVPLELLRKNYQRKLISAAGLRDDPDTVAFLSGVLLNSSTYTNYESHTSPDAQFRLYSILLPISTTRPTNKKQLSQEISNDAVIIKAFPRDNHEIVRMHGVFPMKAGEKFRILVPHGVTGTVTVSNGTASDDDD